MVDKSEIKDYFEDKVEIEKDKKVEAEITRGSVSDPAVEIFMDKYGVRSFEEVEVSRTKVTIMLEMTEDMSQLVDDTTVDNLSEELIENLPRSGTREEFTPDMDKFMSNRGTKDAVVYVNALPMRDVVELRLF